jgi:hypothetical protein
MSNIDASTPPSHLADRYAAAVAGHIDGFGAFAAAFRWLYFSF